MSAGTESIVELRRRLRQKRRAEPAGAAAAAAQQAAERLVDQPEVLAAGTVAVYLAADGEIDPSPAVEVLQERGTVVCAPQFDDTTMEFALLAGQTRPGRFGIAEPVGPPVAVADIDVVVAPLVAVDRSGTRLGMRGGYYDRCFSHLAVGDRPAHPFLFGLAHDFQIVPHLERAAHDVALDALITPEAVLRFVS